MEPLERMMHLGVSQRGRSAFSAGMAAFALVAAVLAMAEDATPWISGDAGRVLLAAVFPGAILAGFFLSSAGGTARPGRAFWFAGCAFAIGAAATVFAELQWNRFEPLFPAGETPVRTILAAGRIAIETLSGAWLPPVLFASACVAWERFDVLARTREADRPVIFRMTAESTETATTALIDAISAAAPESKWRQAPSGDWISPNTCMWLIVEAVGKPSGNLPDDSGPRPVEFLCQLGSRSRPFRPARVHPRRIATVVFDSLARNERVTGASILG